MTEPNQQQPRDVDEFIDTMPEEYLHCRDFGHSWRPFRATWNETAKVYEAVLRCTRCRTQRTRLIGRSGELAGSQYEYADGYTVKGLGRLTAADRDHIRLASIRHLLPKPKPVQAAPDATVTPIRKRRGKAS